MKKILLTFGAIAAVMIALPLFSAFEAHVINVTAQIENALAVTTAAIDFGTVFPQEHLDKPLRVGLSGSFISEERADDVNYIIRQKPKCGVTTSNGTVLVGPTWTGHVYLDAVDALVIDCEQDRPSGVPAHPNDLDFYLLPSLCEYISKEADEDVANDDTTPSFHHPWTFVGRQLVWNDTHGRLAKSEQDTVDDWTIDLAVPCFGGYCAQDWENFVLGVNPNATNTDDYIQPIENEHKVFGCNLWIEVTGVSRLNP